MNNVPSSITYASVVSRKNVLISLTLAALGDVLNAYINAPVNEKV